MLKIFRHKNVSKVVLWLLLILILPAFVLWGAGSIGKGGKKGPDYVGKIDNKKVSFDDFARSMSSVRCQIILNYFNQPKVLGPLLKNKEFIGRLAWDRLIMLSKARSEKIKIPDDAVVAFIGTHPLFLRDGRFDDRIYEYFLKNSLGMDPRSFEELVRENMMVQKMTDTVTKDVSISEKEAFESYKTDNAKFGIVYALISPSDYASQVEVSENEIQDFYDNNKQDFIVKAKDEKGKAEPDKIATYDEMKSTIKSFISESKARPLAAKAAENIYARLRDTMSADKSSFEEAAVKLKLKTAMPKPFTGSEYIEGVGEAAPVAEAAMRLKAGEVSGIVETRKGLVIFKLLSATPADAEKFSKDKEDYTKKVLEGRKNAFAEKWLKGLENKASLNIDLKDYDKYYS